MSSGDSRGKRDVRRLTGALAAVTVALTLAGGCSSDDPPSGAGRAAGYLNAVDRVVLEAERGGASTEQLDILRRRAATSELPFEDYERAVRSALTCVQKAGVEVEGPRVAERQGLKVLTYGTGTSGRTQGTTTDVAHECFLRNSWWVELEYERTPAAISAKFKHFAPYRAPLVACLTRYRVRATMGEQPAELFRKAEVLLQRRASADCLTESGFPVEAGYSW
ncbi:MAG: hypothetical protein GXX79_18270 [Actinomycetales bacterium]|nr:hypothetical protein [Actinomycetales bacterium]